MERPIPEQKSEPLEEPVVSFSHFLIPAEVENIDANDGSNVLLATDYVNDIYAYLRVLEVCIFPYFPPSSCSIDM